jgi:SAM-dependent methyltransferase
MKPNSREWWDNFFISGWIKPKPGINGPDQTRYFMELILKYCGLEISGSVLDYGCAMGQGVELIPGAEGYDFSEEAIKAARRMVPGHEFTSEFPQKKYDVVICSNVLEHFENPLPELEKVLSLAGKYALIMTPYNQNPTCEVHPIAITQLTFPEKINGFRLKEYKFIPNEKPEMGGMNQILFIYEEDK